jgi:hypothetical protein
MSRQTQRKIHSAVPGGIASSWNTDMNEFK